MNKVLEKICASGVSILTIAMFFVFFLAKAYNCFCLVSELSTIKAAFITIIILLLLISFLVVYTKKDLFHTIKRKVNSFNPHVILLLIILASVIVSIACFAFFQSDFYGTSDRETYFKMTEDLVNNGVVTRKAVYARTYSYAFFLSLFYYPIGKLIGVSAVSIFITNLIVFSIRNALIFEIIRKHSGNCVATLFTSFLVLNFEEYFLFRLPTHEHLFVTLSIAVFYLITVIYPKKLSNKARSITIVIMMFLLRFTFVSNASGKIFLASIIIFCIVKYIGIDKKREFIKNKYKEIVCFIMSFIVVFGLCSAIRPVIVDHLVSPIDFSENASENDYNQFWRLVYTGANYESAGEYIIEDVEGYVASVEGSSYEERTQSAKNMALERVRETYSSVFKGIHHLWNKTVKLQGTYGVGLYQYQGRVAHNNLYNYFMGLYLIFSNFVFAFFVFLILIEYRKKDFIKYNEDKIIRVFILGFTMAMMISECNLKYGLNIVYWFIILSAIALPNLKRKIKKKDFN